MFHLDVKIGWVNAYNGVQMSCLAELSIHISKSKNKNDDTHNLSYPNPVHNQMGHPVGENATKYHAAVTPYQSIY